VDCGTRPCGDLPCADPAPPPDDFECPEEEGFYPDPDNCVKHFRCFEGVATEIACKPGTDGRQELYDDVHFICAAANSVNCGDRPICDENDQNCVGQGVTTTPAPNGCLDSIGDLCDAVGEFPEGPCVECWCSCPFAGFPPSEVCCQPGTLYDAGTGICLPATDIPGC